MLISIMSSYELALCDLDLFLAKKYSNDHLLFLQFLMPTVPTVYLTVTFWLIPERDNLMSSSQDVAFSPSEWYSNAKAIVCLSLATVYQLVQCRPWRCSHHLCQSSRRSRPQWAFSIVAGPTVSWSKHTWCLAIVPLSVIFGVPQAMFGSTPGFVIQCARPNVFHGKNVAILICPELAMRFCTWSSNKRVAPC